jgi:translation elongation factor EF-1alpha
MGDAGSGKKTIAGMLLVKNAMMSRSQNAKKNVIVNNLKGASSSLFFLAHHLKVR